MKKFILSLCVFFLISCTPSARTNNTVSNQSDGIVLDDSRLYLKFGETYQLTITLKDKIQIFQPIKLLGKQARWGYHRDGFLDDIFVEIQIGDSKGVYLSITGYDYFDIAIFNNKNTFNGKNNEDGVFCQFIFSRVDNLPYIGSYQEFLDFWKSSKNGSTIANDACKLEKISK